MMGQSKTEKKPRIAVWNSPRLGGPLRWSKDLVQQINASREYSARLVTHPAALIGGHIFPRAELIHAAVPVTYRIWPTPYILTVKGDYTIEKNIWKQVYPRAIAMADVVTVPSQYLRDQVPLLANAIVIPNAVDLQQFNAVAAPETESLEILVVTNFWFPEKSRGISKLLELIQHAKKSKALKKVNVTIVGDGEFMSAIKDQARQYDFATIFPGWSDPRKYFSQTNIFLYYSFHDNMPNAVLEAMAAGLPILTNTVGAIPEMIAHRHDGFIAQNDEEYVQMLIELGSNHKLQQQLGANARRRIERDFSWKRVVQRYLHIYRDLLK